MRAVTALNVRRLGLIIEAVCMLGLLTVFRKEAAQPDAVLGLPVYRIFQVGLGFGLVLWIVGTVCLVRARRKGDE